ncbi:phosphorothioated DNA-binding restriction endonuclease [Streptomyces sp. ID05-47C]|uniref:phosphorothioated DNA-binding restriction endonuclease n=1 Tax=Streptomyces sp. ID05-47C TaxID=3028665 RepID=UPI0029B7BC5F|nr:HNH endonuclease [Streptomyces sp. ID05-47C]MDX3570355.1 HNH endonuclease [Streptomyces sp. ID05-47C]
MRLDELLRALSALRRAQVGGQRAPHKPLLMLWLLTRLHRSGSSAVAYTEAEGPVGRLINDFGPALANPARTPERAAMPFVHLERALWDLRDARGTPLPPSTAERGSLLKKAGAHGRLLPAVESLCADPATLASAVQLLLEEHFTPSLTQPLYDALGLEPETLLTGGDLREVLVRRRARRAGFAEEVLDAYRHACAVCGYDGLLAGRSVGLEAAHIRWHSHHGPDTVTNGLALCALHHTLFDLGALGLTAELRIRISPQYAARSQAGRYLHTLQDQPLAQPDHHSPGPDHIRWHQRQVFKHAAAAA